MSWGHINTLMHEIAQEMAEEMVEAKVAERLPQLVSEQAAQQAEILLKEHLAKIAEEQIKQRQEAITRVLTRRFPQAPLALGEDIRRVRQPDKLETLLVELVDAPDLEAVKRLLVAAADVA